MTQQRNNYFTLVTIIVDVAYLVIWKYITEKILGPDSFETFLNKEKHTLVHIYEILQCCECRILQITRERLISRKQLMVLYRSDERNQIHDHVKFSGNKLTQFCICKYSAKPNIDVRVVDITLAKYIIQKCGKHERGIDTWIQQLTDVRNEIFHLSDLEEITDDLFSRLWRKLEGSIMGIANVIGSACTVETNKCIMQAKGLTFISGDYKLENEIICRGYWTNKCAEFERAHTQGLEEKATALRQTMPQQFRRTMDEDGQQARKRIDTIEHNRNNYFKLLAVIVDVAYVVIWQYIREMLLGPISFETFLNKEKHKLMHMYEKSRCCECMIEKISGERLISRNQLLVLYRSDERNQIRDHKIYTRNKLTQVCICKYSAKENIDVSVVDITLAKYIIQKCGKHGLGIDNWIQQIADVRNEIFHLSDLRNIRDDEFSRTWTKLEESIMGIANVIGSACAVETDKNIMQAKQLTVDVDYMLKSEIISKDYWSNKCAGFERAQNQVIEEKEAVIHHTKPQQLRRMMEIYQKKTNKIETHSTMVDKINLNIKIFGIEENTEQFDTKDLVKEGMQIIFIPVCIQLDIPTYWDKTNVVEAIEEFRLNRTPDMNIRVEAVSIDDLKLYADIAKKLLFDVHELCSEINKMMFTIILEADIDTTESAAFGVTLKVPDTLDPENMSAEDSTNTTNTSDEPAQKKRKQNNTNKYKNAKYIELKRKFDLMSKDQQDVGSWFYKLVICCDGKMVNIDSCNRKIICSNNVKVLNDIKSKGQKVLGNSAEISNHLHSLLGNTEKEYEILLIFSTLQKVKKIKSKDWLLKVIENQHTMACYMLLAYLSGTETEKKDVILPAFRMAITKGDQNITNIISWFIIKEYLRSVSFENDCLLDIWPAVVCNHINCYTSAFCSKELVIVVQTSQLVENLPIAFWDFEVKYLSHTNGKKIHTQKNDRCCNNANLSASVECSFPEKFEIDGNLASELFKKHKKLTFICKSMYKAKDGAKIEKPCIQLFCRGKGLIPIKENHFPKFIENVETDIMEGEPIFSRNIRVGDQINSENYTGTLGGFVKVLGNITFLTCAHVVLPNDSLDGTQIKMPSNEAIHIDCVQTQANSPTSTNSPITFRCGKLRYIEFETDKPKETSIDAALIEMQDDVNIDNEDFIANRTNKTHHFRCLGMRSPFLNENWLDHDKMFYGRHFGQFDNVTVGAVSNITVNRTSTINVREDKEEGLHVNRETFIDTYNRIIQSENQTSAHSSTFSSTAPVFSNDAHLQMTRLTKVDNERKLRRLSRCMYNQIAVTDIPFKPGDSGTCIYVCDNSLDKYGCIGMAIANHPIVDGGVVVTPMKEILKRFPVKI